MIYSITLDKRVHTILGRFTIPTSRSRQPLYDTSRCNVKQFTKYNVTRVSNSSA